MPSRFRSPTCHLSSLLRLGARRSLWIRVSPSVPRRPCALRSISERAGIHGVSQVLRRSSPCMPCPDDPGRPPESHQCDSFAWASRKRKRWPPASCKQRFRGCTRPQGGAGLPYGLHGSLCTLQTFRSVCLTTLLLRICNTRYGWLVRPYPAGTRTLQEAPSLSWRTRLGPNRAVPRSGAVRLRPVLCAHKSVIARLRARKRLLEAGIDKTVGRAVQLTRMVFEILYNNAHKLANWNIRWHAKIPVRRF